MSPLARLRLVLTYLGLGVAAFISVFPFYWMIVGSTNSSADIIRGRAGFGDQIAVNVAAFFTQVDAPQVFGNSAILAFFGTTLTLIISSLAGYGFEIFRSRSRERVFGTLLMMLSIPFAALMVPLFVMMSSLHLANTYTAILLPGIASIFIVFMANWNSYLWPLIILQTNDMKTITLVVSSLASAYTPDYGVVMVGTILATLPTLAVFFLLQRRFVEGMLGSVK